MTPLSVSPGNSWLSAKLECCQADPIEITGQRVGGRYRLRLCFGHQALNHSMYRIAAEQLKNTDEIPEGCCCFNISLQGEMQRICLVVNSLKNRFKVSTEVIFDAAKSDDFGRVVCCRVLTHNLKEAGLWVRNDQRGFHFSVKHHNVSESIYIGEGFAAFGIREIVGRGGSAVVKKARTLEGEILARRVCVVTDANREAVFKMIDLLNRFKGNFGVIDLRAAIHYVSLSHKEKVVTFHSLAEMDLFSLITNWRLSNTQKEDIAEQILTILASLGCAHGDVKPENFLIFKDALGGYQVKVTDLEYVREPTEVGVHTKGTPQWTAPESLFKQDIDVNKLDVWGAGLILLVLFTQPRLPNIPWFTKPGEKFDERKITQEGISTVLSRALISPQIENLLKRMLVFDAEKRCTMAESLEWFQQNVKKPKPSGRNPIGPAAVAWEDSSIPRAHSRGSAFY